MMTKSVAMHVVAELPPELAQEFVEKQSEKGIEECSFFFFFPNSRIEQCRALCQHCFGCSKLGQLIENQRENDDEEPEENEEYIYFDNKGDEINDLKGFSMN